jgi:hypothetical protein
LFGAKLGIGPVSALLTGSPPNAAMQISAGAMRLRGAAFHLSMVDRGISNLRARKQSEFYATPSGEQAPPA